MINALDLPPGLLAIVDEVIEPAPFCCTARVCKWPPAAVRRHAARGRQSRANRTHFPHPELSRRLPVRDMELAGNRVRDLPGAFDEPLDLRAQRSVLQGHDRDWPRPNWQLDGQGLERILVSVELQDRPRERRNVRTSGDQPEAKGRRQSLQAYPRHSETARSERIRDLGVIPRTV